MTFVWRSNNLLYQLFVFNTKYDFDISFDHFVCNRDEFSEIFRIAILPHLKKFFTS